jgi:hypothetical protein
MRKLILTCGLLLALLPAPAPAQEVGPSPVYCNNTFAVSGQSGPVAQTRIVQNPGNAVISLCGWNISNTGGAAVTITFQGGTGSNCGTNTATANMAVTVSNGAQNIDHDPVASRSMAQGQDLCWTITGTGNVNAIIFYGMY